MKDFGVWSVWVFFGIDIGINLKGVDLCFVVLLIIIGVSLLDIIGIEI